MFSMLRSSFMLVWMLAFASITFAETTDDSPVDNKSTYHLSDHIDLVSATALQYAKPKVVIKLSFPRLNNTDESESNIEVTDNTDATDAPNVNSASVTADAFNQLVTSVINDEIDHFKQKVAAAEDYQKTLDKNKVKNRLTVDYSSAIINLDRHPLISIRFIIQGYATGMAQPYRHYRVVNFDVDNASEIQLSELFKSDANYQDILNDYAKSEFEKISRGQLSESAIISSDQFKNWNFNLNGLRFTFDEATVLPAKYGSRTILIPYAKLQELINPDTSFGQCLKHRKNCMREHLLTGGFIDEATNTRHRAFNPVFG